MVMITAASNSLLLNSTTNAQEAQVQNASKNLSLISLIPLKQPLRNKNSNLQLQIDQGVPVKIYVNKDYKSPKAVISKSRR